MDAGLASFDNYFSQNKVASLNGALPQIFAKSAGGSDGEHHTSGESSPWDFSDNLTISFAPNGTLIGTKENTLFDSFESLLSDAKLQSTIVKAFQTWALRSNINFGLQQDNGAPFGTPGETQGDERFGDIRVAAIPLSADIFAVSIPHEELMSGTWAGELLINSNATFSSVDEFFSVILHEAGHILGLDHSADPNSVMHPIARNLTPTVSDSRALRTIYGTRNLDTNEQDGKSNNTIENATEIDNPGKYDGEIPLVVFGDIQQSNDKDFFEIENLNGYTGSLTFQVISKKLSLLLPKVSVFDENGLLLNSSAQTNHRHSEIKITLDSNPNNERYYVLVEGKTNSRFASGTYALAATFDQLNTNSDSELRSVIKSEYSMLEQSEFRKIILGEEFFENDDSNSDDDSQSAQPLVLDERLAGRPVFRFSGSISNAPDIDYFKFETPKSNQQQSMIVKVKSVNDSGFIPRIRVLNGDGNSVQWRYLVNGEGELVIQVDQVTDSTEYKVAVGSADPTTFSTGNYELEVSFSNKAQKLEKFSSGVLAVGKTRVNQGIYVARNQLFNFGLRVKSLGSLNKNGVTVWTTLYDEFGTIIHRVAARPGEMRTTTSVLLDPGSYHLVTSLSYSASAKNALLEKGNVEFSVVGRQVDEPTGPELVDPTKLPFQKCKAGKKYCYPGKVSSPNPFVFVDGRPRGKPSINVKPPKYVDVTSWYWKKNKLQ